VARADGAKNLLLDRVGDDIVQPAVSDHGFQASGELAPSGARVGILIAAGGPICPGLEIDAHVDDVAPTVLRLLDMPIISGLDGRVLDELIEPRFLAKHPVRTIDPFEGLVQSTEGGILRGPCHVIPHGARATYPELSKLLRPKKPGKNNLNNRGQDYPSRGRRR
jgi:hypothetical protein